MRCLPFSLFSLFCPYPSAHALLTLINEAVLPASPPHDASISITDTLSSCYRRRDQLVHVILPWVESMSLPYFSPPLTRPNAVPQ